MRPSYTQLIKFIFAASVAGIPATASAFSPDNHEKSIVEGARIATAMFGIRFAKDTLKHIIKGVLEPDQFSIASAQMLFQRVEPGSHGKQRDINTIRIAAQSIHGSPNPTRKTYKNTQKDQAAFAQTIRLPDAELMPDRFDIDVYSYDTNQGVRNKILINSSQFLCVSLAHQEPWQAAMKFGNFMHMIGDTYSASHVQRTEPTGKPKQCGTEKIEWHYSMDLISWKLHRPADLKSDDWRFQCLVEHTGTLISRWAESRDAVSQVQDPASKQRQTHRELRKTLRYLCEKVLREDEAVLRKPAGGAAAGYSSASGTDNWRLLKKKRPDRPIQPVGLTGKAEAKQFYRSIAQKLRKAGSEAQFSYPSRDVPDLCKNILSNAPLHPTLQCTADEIHWAMSADRRVRSMWIPARDLP